MLVVMMEKPEALEHVEEIAVVDRIGLLLVGTNELTTEMGIVGQFDDPRVRDAYVRTTAVCGNTANISASMGCRHAPISSPKP